MLRIILGIKLKSILFIKDIDHQRCFQGIQTKHDAFSLLSANHRFGTHSALIDKDDIGLHIKGF